MFCLNNDVFPCSACWSLLQRIRACNDDKLGPHTVVENGCVMCKAAISCEATTKPAQQRITWENANMNETSCKTQQKTTTKNKKWTTKNNTTTPQHHHHRKTSVPLDNVDELGWNILSGRGSQCFDGRVQSSTCIHVGTCSPLNKTYCSVPTKDDPQTHCTDCRRHLPEMQPTKQYCAS